MGFFDRFKKKKHQEEELNEQEAVLDENSGETSTESGGTEIGASGYTEAEAPVQPDGGVPAAEEPEQSGNYAAFEAPEAEAEEPLTQPEKIPEPEEAEEPEEIPQAMEAPAPEEETEPEEVPQEEVPEPDFTEQSEEAPKKQGFFEKLKNGLKKTKDGFMSKLELLMNQAGLTMGAREVEKQAHARSEATGGAPAAAIELSDGTVITGKTGPLLGATASALINALKYLAGIPQETDLVSAAAIEPIQTLKTNYLGGKNPRLHTDEILIALSSSAASSELAAAAMHQLPNLKGCDVHSTVLLSSVDSSTLNRLGMYLTCDPVYEEEDRKYHKL